MMNYRTREDQIRSELSKEEAIRRIENNYPAKFNLNSNLDAWDQLLVCDAVAESTPIFEDEDLERTNGNENVTGSANGSYKNEINFELTESKLTAISKLKSFKADTHSKEIEDQLEIIFEGSESYPGHWHNVAVYHNPRQIIWSLNYLLKIHNKGQIRKSAAACFTDNLKRRVKRKN